MANSGRRGSVSGPAGWLRPDWWDAVSRESLRRDAVAGASVAVMLVPQAMAYATLAGLPPTFGLYASLVPLLVYPLFGTARQLAVGVVALDMLILGSGLLRVADPSSPEFVTLAILTAALVGLIQVAMAGLRLGFLADLLSRPVITGFTAAAALVIAASQVGPLLGVQVPRSEFVHEIVLAMTGRLDAVHLPTAFLGAACVVVLVGLRRFAPGIPGALVVVVGGVVAVWLGDLGERGVAVTGPVPAGLPNLSFDAFRVDAVPRVITLAGTLAVIQLMSVISIGRSLSARHRYTVRPNRELLGLGLANLAGSLFRGIPVSGSFSRSAVNDDAGAQTPLANVVAAAAVAIVLLFLTPVFRFLPSTALAAIILVSAVGLIEPGNFVRLLRVYRQDGLLALGTMAATLALGIQEGIILGVVASTLMVLYRLSRPHIAELGFVPGTSFFRDRRRFDSAEEVEGIKVLRVDAGFSFVNAAHLRDQLLHRSDENHEDRPEIRAVVIEARGINDMDTTALDALRELVGTLRTWDMELHFAGLKGKVRDVLRRSDLSDELDEEVFHLSSHHAVRTILAEWDDEDGGDREDGFVERTVGEGNRDEERGGPLT